MCVRSIKHSCCNHKAQPKRGENGNPCLEAAILYSLALIYLAPLTKNEVTLFVDGLS